MPTLGALARASESKSREAIHQRAKKMKHHYREVSMLESAIATVFRTLSTQHIPYPSTLST